MHLSFNFLSITNYREYVQFGGIVKKKNVQFGDFITCVSFENLCCFSFLIFPYAFSEIVTKSFPGF